MKLTQIVGLVNTKLAGETLTYNQMLSYLDETIIDINTQLNACFPTFSELYPSLVSDATYDAFPDQYITSVVVIGAALKFYTTDEEGLSVATGFQQEYDRGLFYMVRDYSASVPEKYQAKNRGYIEGSAPSSGLDMSYYKPGCRFPINPDLRIVEGPRGLPGRDGIDGKDGKDGVNGKDGINGKDGVNGKDGKDGINGKDGTDGYTPVRGVDYWTEHDKEIIQSQIKLPILRGIYNPQAVSLSVDGVHAVSDYLDSAGNYGWSMAGSDSLGFFFPLEDNIENLLGKNIDYKLTINTVAAATTLLESAYIGIAFVKFENTVDPNGVTSYSSISSNSIIDTINGAHTYSSVLPETVPYGYGGCKLAIYALFNYSAYADGLVSVSNPSAIIDVENPDNWFVWNAAANRYVNSNVSAKGYIPQKGIDYWTDADIAEIKGYVDENMSGAEKVANKVTSINETSTNIEYPSAKAVVDYVGDKIPLIINIWEDEAGKTICGSENVYSDLKSAFDAHRPIIVYQWDSPAMNTIKLSYTLVYADIITNSITMWFSGAYNNVSRTLIFVASSDSNYDFSITTFKLENTENKVIALSADSTDDEYPTAKAVVDYVGNIETALDGIIAEQNSIIAIQNTLIGGETV